MALEGYDVIICHILGLAHICMCNIAIIHILHMYIYICWEIWIHHLYHNYDKCTPFYFFLNIIIMSIPSGYMFPNTNIHGHSKVMTWSYAICWDWYTYVCVILRLSILSICTYIYVGKYEYIIYIAITTNAPLFISI